MNSIAVLFARSDSIYKQMNECDVFDLKRDARTFEGGKAIIAHPPCRSWGRLAHLAKPVLGERELALLAVDLVREWGGVLEHPEASRLWKEKPLPEPGQRDEFGGFTVIVAQWWFGHKAEKMTRLYICGIEPDQIPPMQLKLGEPEYCVAKSRRNPWGKKEITKAEREATPIEFARFLIEIAERANENRGNAGNSTADYERREGHQSSADTQAGETKLDR